MFFIVVYVHHHHHALFTIFPLPGARPLPTTVFLPGAPPSATFWKVCLGSVKASFVCAPKGKYPGKKRQGANILKKQGKKEKERKIRTIQGNRIIFGGQVFSPVGRHPPSLFWDLVQYSSLFQIVKFWKDDFRLLCAPLIWALVFLSGREHTRAPSLLVLLPLHVYTCFQQHSDVFSTIIQPCIAV